MVPLFLVTEITEHFPIDGVFDVRKFGSQLCLQWAWVNRAEGPVTWLLFACFTGEASDIWGGVAVIWEWSLGRGLSCLSAKGHTCLAPASAMGPGPHLLPSSSGVTPQLFGSLLVVPSTPQHLLPLPSPSPPSSIRRWRLNPAHSLAGGVWGYLLPSTVAA